MKTARICATLGVLLCAAIAGAMPAEKIGTVPTSTINWVPEKEMPQIAMHVLWGDPKTGPYGAFLRFDGGLELPLHWHTFENRGVLVSGTFAVEVDGKETVVTEPGAYFFLDGKVPHKTRCKSKTPCVIFATQSGIDDIHMVEAKK